MERKKRTKLRTKLVNIRVSEDEYNKLVENAKEKCMTFSEYIRTRCIEKK